MDNVLPIIEHDTELGQYFQRFTEGDQTFMTVPEASFTLTPTANIEIRHTQAVLDTTVIQLPIRTVPIFTFSNGTSEDDPAFSYSKYIDEFLIANPDLDDFINKTNLPPKAFFAVDLARTRKLICLIPTL
ncbi:hypothetical protein KC678_02415 [Candidatus Dojkabacteria bacterium]|uniref:Uncharacterized protein n=1 Tax=Candidatus Dojkabacteria bacterium TaxID=2099670 RepID=A0A955L1C0_9BACT|nr:hypothetical protein [Candidatus Dojkabacteria bacterium]